VAAHHGEVPSDSLHAIVVSIADAISSARPGARREALEHYVRRLHRLEEIAAAHPGVEKAYAIQAGREIRILVQHELVGDEAANGLAHAVARQIERDLPIPGQVKVVVIREMRAVDFAR
jgi:ribonuclease Y